MTHRAEVVIPHRWVGHGRDVRACRIADEWRYIADDLEAIIGPLHLIADVVLTPDAVLNLDIADQALATLTRGHVAMWIDAAPASPDLDEFRTWFANLTYQLEDAADDAVAAASHPEPAATAERLYTAQLAAEILSRTPGIDIGPIGLFRLLHKLDWIQRDEQGSWTPTEPARRAGYLTTRPVRIGTAWTGHYLQVMLAPDALAELQRVLAGGGELTVERAEPTPTLVEIP